MDKLYSEIKKEFNNSSSAQSQQFESLKESAYGPSGSYLSIESELL